jgi:SAM-dependent methyltransferase
MTLRDDRIKWNRRYAESDQPDTRPEPHAMALAWRHLFIGGAMLDAACGLGRGIASGLGAFHPVYAVDLSEPGLRRARALWSDTPDIRWIVSDVNDLQWPSTRFGLICSFGFTDMNFFRRVPKLLKPGGMFLYEGFSARQKTVKPDLNADWIGDPDALRALFAGGRVLECAETGEPPFRLRLAALAP